MCLAIPAKIESLEGDKAVIDLAGARATAMTSLTPQAKVGDWVLVHAGYAITVLDEKDARETFAIFREMENVGWDEAERSPGNSEKGGASSHPTAE